MNIAIILLIGIVLLFLTAYFTKRRFGVLALALAAGSILSTMWAADVTPLVRSAGIELLSPPLSAVVAVLLVLLPALLLLFSGPSYHSFWKRIIGSAMFALLATALMLQPLGGGLNLDEMGETIYNLLLDNRNLIITVAIAYALFDIVTLKTPKKKEGE